MFQIEKGCLSLFDDVCKMRFLLACFNNELAGGMVENIKIEEGSGRTCWPVSFLRGVVVGILLLSAGGCVRVPVHQQRLVSKHNMQFSDSKIFDYGNPLQGQIEPASEDAGSSKSSGCTSCN